jgi:hypothetical protein
MMEDVPVILPPGRARLATNPEPTASGTDMTTGIVVVVFLTAWTTGVDLATITSTFMRTSSAARSERRSTFPST